MCMYSNVIGVVCSDDIRKLYQQPQNWKYSDIASIYINIGSTADTHDVVCAI